MNVNPWSESSISSSILHATSDIFGDFTDWITTIVDEVKPDYLVGIARGAVRLLQLHQVAETLAVPILSDYALPFFRASELKGKTVLLFDDSVIFGSTLADVKQYLLDRGAIVFCAAYTIDRHNFLGEPDPKTGKMVRQSVHSEISVRSRKLLWPDQIRRHHNTVIDAILDTKRDYNLDFPKICLKTSPYSAADLPYLLNHIASAPNFHNLYSVSTPMSVARGIFRYTALTKTKMCGAILEDNFRIRPYTKIRLTFIPESSEINLTPIPQLALRESALKTDIHFRDEQLQSFWRQLDLPESSNHDVYSKALFRLATFFEGLFFGYPLTEELRTALTAELDINSRDLAGEDVEPVIGSHNSQVVNALWKSLASWKTDTIGSSPYLVTDDHEYRNEELLQAISEKWNSTSSLRPIDGEAVYEILGKVFLTLRAVTDNTKARVENPGVSRLEVGLTFEGIQALLKEKCGISLSADEISLAIDVCVDNGQAVPKIIRHDGMFIRAFYSGENQHAHSTLQLKDAFHQAYTEFTSQKKVSLLSEFDLHKVAVTLKDLMPWLPFSTKPYTFGRIAVLMQAFEERKLTDWLVNHGSGPLRFITDDAGKQVLTISHSYEKCVEPSWSSNKTRAFLDGFHYIATAFSSLKDSAPKLLLSTCRTHRHTFNAVAVEAHNWIENERGNFRKLLSGSRLTANESISEPQTTLESIYFCTRFLSEARQKYDIFHSKFNETFRQLEKAFTKQGGLAKRFWELHILEEKNLLDQTRDEEIVLRFDGLMPLLTQMRQLTAFYVGTLRNLGFVTYEDVARLFEQNGASAKDPAFRWLFENNPGSSALVYNDNISKGKVAGLSIEKTQISATPYDNTAPMAWFHDVHRNVADCFGELTASLYIACPRYETPESGTDFPFSPENDRLVQVDGTQERILRDVFILTVEIVKSTDNIQTNQMKDTVLRSFENFPRTAEFHFDVSGNDAFVACSRDAMVLIDIAKQLMREGEALKKFGGSFGGTRKGLFRGTVRHVIDSEDQERLTDAFTPHILPQAFSILDGLDERFKNDPAQLNRAMIVDRSVASDVFARLNIQFQKQNSFRVKSKHYLGRCFCFDLAEMKIR